MLNNIVNIALIVLLIADTVVNLKTHKSNKALSKQNEDVVKYVELATEKLYENRIQIQEFNNKTKAYNNRIKELTKFMRNARTGKQ